jgi:hypothetical protein
MMRVFWVQQAHIMAAAEDLISSCPPIRRFSGQRLVVGRFS